MDLINTDIIVGRDRSHVKELIKTYPTKEVISAAEFFQKLTPLPFLFNAKLKLDNNAPLKLAIKSLLKNKLFNINLSKNFATLYASFLHGLTYPSEIILNHQQAGSEDLAKILNILIDIEEETKKEQLVTQVGALFLANNILKEKKFLPPIFLKKSKVALVYLIDMTLLEIDLIKSLSKLGVFFEIIFPGNFVDRNINTPIDFIAKQFENDLELNNINISFPNIKHNIEISYLSEGLLLEDILYEFNSDRVDISTYQQLLDEANNVAQRIAFRKSENPHSKIALAVRALDERSMLFKEAVQRYDIGIKDRKGINLIKTPCGSLLNIFLEMRLNNFKKSNLISLISNELYIHYLEPIERSKLITLLAKIGIDGGKDSDNFIKIDRFAKIFPHLECDELIKILGDMLKIPQKILAKSTFNGFIDNILSLLEQSLNLELEDESVVRVKEFLFNLRSGLDVDEQINFKDFHGIIINELTRATVPSGDNEDQLAVEFLLLPELLGRSFDHVFIVDISFGRLPHNVIDDPICPDSMRNKINKLAQRPVLRIFFDDPFDPLPVPPRQALEPFWFASAILSAKHSVEFSCSLENERGQSQSPSEFFYWLEKYVEIIKQKYTKFISQEEQKFLHGLNAKESLCHQAFFQRKKAFLHKEASAYGFSYEPNDINSIVKDSFSPSMIEKFSACGFLALMEKIFSAQFTPEGHEDLDSRIMGKIAHKVLERYFAQKNTDLLLLIDNIVKEFLAKNYINNLDVFFVYVEWLKLSLKIFIDSSYEMPELQNSQIIASEKFLKDKFPIEIDHKKYLLSGVVDRLDKTNNNYLIIDYKLSSVAYLRSQLSPKNLLINSFQAPIYWRLVANNLSDQNPDKVRLAFFSIRDSKMVLADSLMGSADMKERIFNDHSSESLAKKINDIFSPILKGRVLAKKNDQCPDCEFKYVCRVKEINSYVY